MRWFVPQQIKQLSRKRKRPRGPSAERLTRARLKADAFAVERDRLLAEQRRAYDEIMKQATSLS